MAFDASQYATVNVTKEFFVIPENGEPMFLKFQTPFQPDASIEVRTRRTKEGENTADKKPMEIADVVNLATGEEGRLIGNEVIKSQLRSKYPDEGYVNRMFQISQGQQKTGRGGNKYRSFKIIELVPKTSSESAEQSAKHSRK